uniref:MAM domain-containing protein n=1 Tax=Schistosoma mansoni TaxID=6183 RepID=A0A5K4F9S9_SCHMA
MKIVCSILFLFVLSVKGTNFPKLKSQEYENVPRPNSNNLLYCDFDNAKMEFCHWQGDPRNDKAHWKHEYMTTDLHNGIICLQPRNIQTYRLRKIYSDQRNSLTARLWSETVEPVITSNENSDYMEYSLNSPQNSLRCIQFQYKIQLHDSNVDPPTSNSIDNALINLSLLKHSTGSCELAKHHRTGGLATVCANDPLWYSSILPSDRPKNTPFLDWQLAYVSLNSNDTEQKDYKLILEGTIPAGYPDARICVDNITSYTEPCSALEKASAPLPSQWSWAQYFGLTFVGALILGLLIPVLFLVILIWACRRRHHAMHSNYTNSKLFSTNLWYYIGGKEICDDPNGFRGSSSMLRSKQFNSPSATGTLLNGGGGGHHLMLSNADVMDLPDVVVPGGRVVAFNYSGNTLGGNTLRHNHNNAGYTNTNYLSNAQNNQVMLTNVNGTVSLNNCGTNVTTVARTGQNTMPLVSNELIQQQSQSQQQNEAYNYQTNPVFGESVSMAVMTASQSPMLMTQSMAPNYGSEANHVAQSNFSNTNTQQINQLNPSGQAYNKPTVQQQHHQPRAQSQYFPPTQQSQTNLIQPQPQIAQSFQQPSNFQFQNQPQQQQQLVANQTPASNQFHPQQQQSVQQSQQQQFSLPPPPPTCQLHQMNLQQATNLPSQTQQQNQPVSFNQQSVNHQYPFQSQPSQVQQPIPTDQRRQQVVNGQVQTSIAVVTALTAPTPLGTSQQNCQPLQQQPNTNTTNPGNNNNNLNSGNALIIASNNRCLSMSPTSIGTDSLTEADQQAAMALLAAATEGMDTFRENQTTPSSLQSPIPIVNNNISRLDSCLNTTTNTTNTTNNNNNNNAQVPVDEDNPPPGYDEAIGLIQNNFMNNVNMAMMMNTMVKPAVPIPNTTCTPPPALPPRRIINGVGLEDIEDPQSMTSCISLAERYGLPVAEI